MRAKSGDHLVIMGHVVNEHGRDGEIIEVLGEDGQPPYRVRWSDDGHETLVFPGADAKVEHKSERRHQPAGS